MDLFEDVAGAIDKFAEREQEFDPYMFWEPWDCVEPTPEIIAMAAEDGVDLFKDDVSKLAGQYPRLFQTGHVLSKKPVSCIQAASRVGKSAANAVVLGASLSKQPPYSMRYEEGEDTGILREVTSINIARFGRRDSTSGTLIDYNVNVPTDHKSWNCGNITGVGIFPEELYCPDGGQLWVGTLPRSIDTYWWPALAGTGKQRFLPTEFLDRSRGANGSNRQRLEIYAPRDITLFVKSYDADYKTFESQDCHILFWDEEPTKVPIYTSGAGHSEYQRFSFTPLNGLSWSESLFFGNISSKAKQRGMEYGIGSLAEEDFDYFQASQFDSPYVGEKKRIRNRNTFSMWERKSKLWGRYSQYEGTPFFDRSKIQIWEQNFCHSYSICTFNMRRAWDGMYTKTMSHLPGLLSTKVRREEVEEEDMRSTWRIYENPRKGVGYLAIFDAAEGAIDPAQVQDKSFGMIVRAWEKEDGEALEDVYIIVATTRTTLPTIAFARSCFPVLRYYNNAILAAERGHGKDNEAFGITLDDWPFWYYYTATNDTTKRLHQKKGCDTNSKTRTLYFDNIRDWLNAFAADEDPFIRDSWLYDELGGAVIKKTANGKQKCDHTKDGSLDGVICMGIATYIFKESPDIVICNSTEEDAESTNSFRDQLNRRLTLEEEAKEKPRAMGAGIAGLGKR